MGKIKNRVGEKYITNEGYEIEIIEYFNSEVCTVLINNSIIIKNIRYGSIKRGKVNNPYHKGVASVGYLGEGIYNLKNKSNLKIYCVWSSMLKRCYDEKHRQKHPTYKDVTVCEEWHNFQVFAKWFEENYKEGLCLDKDILCKDCKIYSPETCCFVPHEINNIFKNSKRRHLPTGVYKNGNKFYSLIEINNSEKYLGTFNTPEEAFQVYKSEKEKHIKEVADKWKGIITDITYQAIYNWSISYNTI